MVAPQWRVVERRRIDYEPEPTRFIYHHASELRPSAAETAIETARAQAVEKARIAIETLIDSVRSKGMSVTGAGVPGGNTRLPDSLAEIVAAHARIHAAEGAFYRDVLAEACERMKFRVKRTPERDLWEVASKASGFSAEKLRHRFVVLGKELGAPWGEDQKLAALAAFTAL